MKLVKNYLYIFAIALLVIFVFFKKDFPIKIYNVLSFLPAVLIIIALLLEVLTRKRNEK